MKHGVQSLLVDSRPTLPTSL